MGTASGLWQECSTVLLDMDGTLLDLAFDNWFWHEAVPRCLARARGAAAEEVRAELLAQYARKQGSLDWYCLDYWSNHLGFDLRALKEASSHRIRYLPGAREFLRRASASGRRMVLVTNAHGDTLRVKHGVSGLAGFFEQCISSHEFGMPKESADFWPQLRERLGFDPASTLFVDDSPPVLDAAAAFGLRAVIAVSRPDSRQPQRAPGRHRAVVSVGELIG
ncbi:MAG: GMP/IMP nucleotidase [Gammaproteobacteria bacterium]|nr:GMP/IMP nucleotidase [Gammaproteobacteria bacterium]